MGLRTGGRRAKSLKNRVKSSKIELRFREIRSEGCPSRTSVQQALILPERYAFNGSASAEPFLFTCSKTLLNRGARHPASAAQLCALQFGKCNGDDRRLRRKQGGAVGAAASKTRVPPKARSGCWEPQPGGTFPAVLLRQNCFFVASFPAELRCATAHVRRHSNHLYSPAQIFSNRSGLLNAHFPHPRYTVVENESEGSV